MLSRDWYRDSMLYSLVFMFVHLCVLAVECGAADVFFFKPKTAYEMRISDWSSDVCSSDLGRGQAMDVERNLHRAHDIGLAVHQRSVAVEDNQPVHCRQ